VADIGRTFWVVEFGDRQIMTDNVQP